MEEKTMGYVIVMVLIGVTIALAMAAASALKFSRLLVAAAGAAVAIIATIASSASSVPAGHVGLVRGFGAIVGQRGEGLQWVAPWQNLEPASVQTRGHKFEKMTSFSSETQSITVTATINVSVLPAGIQALYREVGDKYFDVLIQPRVFQAFKDETVKYSSIDIAPKREEIRAAVREKLKAEMEAHSILVQDLLIDDISFGDKFEAAIEEKQTQSQLALAEKEKVSSERSKADQQLEHARGEAGAILINADKQAEANKKLSESLSPAFLQYLAITKLSPNVSVMMVPPSQGLLFDIGKKP